MYTGTVYLLSFMFICLNWTLTASSTYTIGKAQTLNYAHTDTHTQKKHIIIIRLLRYIETQRKINTTAVKTRQKKNKTPFFFFPDFLYFYPFSKNYYLNYIFSLIPFLFCFVFLFLLVMILSL